MKHKRNITWSLLVAPALLAFSPRASEVSFGPEASSSLTKTFSTDGEMSLDDMTMVQNGQEIDASMMGMEMSATSTYTVTVTDEYMAVADGRPTKFVRTFDEISTSSAVSTANAMMGESNMEIDGSSELEGVRVQFTWDDDAGEYTASFPEGEDGDEELLEGLDASMDMIAMLPEGEVSEGDTWSVDAQALRAIFAPGGAVKIEMEMPEEDGMGMGSQPTPDQFIGDMEGEVTAEFAGTRDEGGVQVAVIKLSANVSSSTDISELMGDMMNDMGDAQGFEIDLESMDSEFSFEGEGELLWNLAQGVVFGLEMTGEVSQVMDTVMTINAQGQEMGFEQSMSLGGNQTISVSTEQNS